MTRSWLVTLLTDFGTRDWFVGTMKGVIQSIAPQATVIDLTHEIAAGDIRAAAFALAASYRFFPKGTVHLVVVDPGVGSARRPLAVETATHFFIGPDNGVLTWALKREKILAPHSLENPDYFLTPVSRTFQGRDVFAPVAAHLCRGVPLRRFGPAVKEFVRLDWPEPKQTSRALRGEVIYIDRFGNAITNLEASRLPRRGFLDVFVNGKRLCPVAEFYQAVPRGRPVAVQGSSGFLEVAVNGGNAAKRLGIRIGAAVCVSPARTQSPNS
jgi:S-adenosylmethionine hydrolase